MIVVNNASVGVVEDAHNSYTDPAHSFPAELLTPSNAVEVVSCAYVRAATTAVPKFSLTIMFPSERPAHAMLTLPGTTVLTVAVFPAPEKENMLNCDDAFKPISYPVVPEPSPNKTGFDATFVGAENTTQIEKSPEKSPQSDPVPLE